MNINKALLSFWICLLLDITGILLWAVERLEGAIDMLQSTIDRLQSTIDKLQDHQDGHFGG